LSPEDAAKRAASRYGEERYETLSFQAKVADNFQALKDSTWVTVDASGSIQQVHQMVRTHVDAVMEANKCKPIGKLWIPDSHDTA
jgi:thymidylate kinase